MTNDAISRQAAIDAVTAWLHKALYPLNRSQYNDGEVAAYETALSELKEIPSAQPEIIRCNSCKHWTQSTGKMEGFGLGRCDFHEADLVTCLGFCYWAERREK